MSAGSSGSVRPLWANLVVHTASGLTMSNFVVPARISDSWSELLCASLTLTSTPVSSLKPLISSGSS
jgi:hypothetical protein